MQTQLQKLIKQRTHQRLSLEDVHNITQIPLAYLEALERGDIAYYHDSMEYYRYHYRLYCRAIGYSYGEIQEALESQISSFQERAGQKPEPVVSPKLPKESRNHQRLILVIVGAILLVLLVWFVSFFLGGTLSLHKETREQTVVSPEAKKTVVKRIVKKVEEKPRAQYQLEQNGAGSYQLRLINGNQWQIRVQGKSWLALRINGNPLPEYPDRVYQDGERINIVFPTGDSTFSLHTGFLPGLKFYVGEEEVQIPLATASGHALKMEFKVKVEGEVK